MSSANRPWRGSRADSSGRDDEDDDDVGPMVAHVDPANPAQALTDEQRTEEGRRMFQIFAARLFEQRVHQAWKEKVHREQAEAFLRELENEQKQEAEAQARKAKEAQKKKDKKKCVAPSSLSREQPLTALTGPKKSVRKPTSVNAKPRPLPKPPPPRPPKKPRKGKPPRNVRKSARVKRPKRRHAWRKRCARRRRSASVWLKSVSARPSACASKRKRMSVPDSRGRLGKRSAR